MNEKIIKQTSGLYHAQCQKCGDYGPVHEYFSIAMAWAMEFGWHIDDEKCVCKACRLHTERIKR